MKSKSVLLCVAVAIFMGVVTSCKKDRRDYIIPDEKDTTVIVPPKEDIIYVIDTTKKITINEIKFWEDYNMAAVSGTWQGVAYGNGLWVAVGQAIGGNDIDGIIGVSTDGINWTTQRITQAAYLQGVAYGNGLWVAVGFGYSGTSSFSCTVTSTDGINWTTQSFSSMGRRIAYGNNLWITVRSMNGYILKSANNGTSWTPIQLGGTALDWNDVAYGEGRWVIVGKSGQTSTSTDGSGWSTLAAGTDDWQGVAYGNGSWVAVGVDGNIATSTDGLSWSVQRVGTDDWNDVAYGNGLWVAVGRDVWLAISTDGTNWTRMYRSQGYWNGVAIKND
jgi:hypothetical protein